MNNFLILIILISFLSSCSRTKKEEHELEIVVRAFSNSLYTNYHLYNDRERRDNTGKLKGTWPRSIRVDNPHDTARQRREKAEKVRN